MKFDSIDLAVEDIRNGKCIIVVDNEDRENEGDLVFCASDVTGQKINFMAHIRNKISLICLHKVTKLMDFISKSQGYIPLKAVPYIFFLAVVLSITTSTYTFV